MNVATIVMLVLAASGQQGGEGTPKEQRAKAKHRRLLELHTDDAASYSIYRDAGRTQKLELRREPVYRWTNPTRVGGQVGDDSTADPDVVDGALFTLVSSAGTDPEIILLLEARQSQIGAQWLYGPARFSDMNLWLKHKGNEVWSSIRSDENTFNHDGKHRFRFYQDRIIPEVGEVGSKEVK